MYNNQYITENMYVSNTSSSNIIFPFVHGIGKARMHALLVNGAARATYDTGA